MTRDDIIRMAREARCIPVRHPEYDVDVQVFATADDLERFAALVAAAEREAVCRIVTGLCISDNNAEEINRAIRARGQS
jgi:Ni,Fe-hydrogenase III small subunit